METWATEGCNEWTGQCQWMVNEGRRERKARDTMIGLRFLFALKEGKLTRRAHQSSIDARLSAVLLLHRLQMRVVNSVAESELDRASFPLFSNWLCLSLSVDGCLRMRGRVRAGESMLVVVSMLAPRISREYSGGGGETLSDPM